MDVITMNLQAGMDAARADDKELAKTLFLRVLAGDPRNETAWLWLSGVMPTTEQSLRCIEQLLSINPAHARALEAREVLRLRLLVEEAAVTNSSQASSSTPQRRYLLGEALVEARIISQEQLDQALRKQAKRTWLTQPKRLGDLLVKLKMITREQLEAALNAQLESMAPVSDSHAQRLGEFLVLKGKITPAQLHQALSQQAQCKTHGQPVQIGEVLTQCGYIDRLELQHMLLEWHHRQIVQEDVS